jgi:hypothetical protein
MFSDKWFWMLPLVIGSYVLPLQAVERGLSSMPDYTLLKTLKQKRITPQQEAEIISKVAKKYKLTPTETALLKAIRKAENGPQGLEFGVVNPKARRFKDDPDPTKSYTVQAMWAAGTIKKRFDGDIGKFAERYAPIGAENDPENLNKNWEKNVEYFMKQDTKKKSANVFSNSLANPILDGGGM